MKSRMQEETKEEIEAEDFIPYNEIDKLQTMGINAADLNKLKAAGNPLSAFLDIFKDIVLSCLLLWPPGRIS